MDRKHASNYVDYGRIEKLNNLTNLDTFWDEVDKLTKNLTSDLAIKSWKHLAEIRYSELIKDGGLTESEVIRKTSTEQSNEDSLLADIEKLINGARIEQKILDNMMHKLYQKLDELNIDLNVPTAAENARCLKEAINCYICHGEFSLKELVEEIRGQYVVN